MAGRWFNSLDRDADDELLQYLRSRNISRAFLREIDMFLSEHPEIADSRNKLCIEFTQKINHSSPFEAYMFFVEGYTKPARYEDGVLLEVHNLLALESALPLVSQIDKELTRFFGASSGDYRYDLLADVDKEVNRIAHAISCHAHVSYQERKLVSLAVHGNPVDAYKFYEYNYQCDYLPHRYVPEHGVLLGLQKIVSRYDLRTYQLEFCLEDCADNARSYPVVRARMRNAHDNGVDVVDVLIDEYTTELARKKFSRVQIYRMTYEAKIDFINQIDIRGRRDIVEMVMDRARGPESEYQSNHSAQPPLSAKLKINELKYHVQQMYNREATFYDDVLSAEDMEVRHKRRSLERELVAEVTHFGLFEGSMTVDVATEWRRAFTEGAQEVREEKGDWFNILNYL